MRLKTLTSFLIILLCSAGTKNILAQQVSLNGTWLTEKMEIDGVDLPAAAFEKQKLILNDSNYTFIAESVDKGVVRYTNDKLDIYGKDGVNAGKHFTAIYKFEGEQLVICYNLAGNGYPETYETRGKPTYFIAVFKKEKTE